MVGARSYPLVLVMGVCWPRCRLVFGKGLGREVENIWRADAKFKSSRVCYYFCMVVSPPLSGILRPGIFMQGVAIARS